MPNKPQVLAIAGTCCIVVCVLATLAQCHSVGLHGRVCARYARTRHADAGTLAARFLPGGVSMRAVRPPRVVRPRGCRARADGRGSPLSARPRAAFVRFGLAAVPALWRLPPSSPGSRPAVARPALFTLYYYLSGSRAAGAARRLKCRLCSALARFAGVVQSAFPTFATLISGGFSRLRYAPSGSARAVLAYRPPLRYYLRLSCRLFLAVRSSYIRLRSLRATLWWCPCGSMQFALPTLATLVSGDTLVMSMRLNAVRVSYTRLRSLRATLGRYALVIRR